MPKTSVANRPQTLYGLSDSSPSALSAFSHEIYTAPRSWSEKAYPKLVYYKKHDVGGHFAAWEQPQLFCEDVRASFQSVRPGNA